MVLRNQVLGRAVWVKCAGMDGMGADCTPACNAISHTGTVRTTDRTGAATSCPRRYPRLGRCGPWMPATYGQVGVG